MLIDLSAILRGEIREMKIDGEIFRSHELLLDKFYVEIAYLLMFHQVIF